MDRLTLPVEEPPPSRKKRTLPIEEPPAAVPRAKLPVEEPPKPDTAGKFIADAVDFAPKPDDPQKPKLVKDPAYPRNFIADALDFGPKSDPKVSPEVREHQRAKNQEFELDRQLKEYDQTPQGIADAQWARRQQLEKVVKATIAAEEAITGEKPQAGGSTKTDADGNLIVTAPDGRTMKMRPSEPAPLPRNNFSQDGGAIRSHEDVEAFRAKKAQEKENKRQQRSKILSKFPEYVSMTDDERELAYSRLPLDDPQRVRLQEITRPGQPFDPKLEPLDLSTGEELLRTGKRALAQASTVFEAPGRLAAQALAPAGGEADAAMRLGEARARVMENNPRSTTLSGLQETAIDVAEVAPQLIAQIVAAKLTGGSSLAFAATAVAPVVAQTYADTFDEVYRATGDTSAANLSAMPAAIAVGAVTYLTSKAEFEFLKSMPSTRFSLVQFAMNRARGALAEGGQEGIEEIAAIMADVVVRAANDMTPIPLEARIEQFLKAVKTGAIAGTALPRPIKDSAIEAYTELNQMRQRQDFDATAARFRPPRPPLKDDPEELRQAAEIAKASDPEHAQALRRKAYDAENVQGVVDTDVLDAEEAAQVGRGLPIEEPPPASAAPQTPAAPTPAAASAPLPVQEPPKSVGQSALERMKARRKQTSPPAGVEQEPPPAPPALTTPAESTNADDTAQSPQAPQATPDVSDQTDEGVQSPAAADTGEPATAEPQAPEGATEPELEKPNFGGSALINKPVADQAIKDGKLDLDDNGDLVVGENREDVTRKKAEVVGGDKALLRKRLNEAKSVLDDSARDGFGEGVYDFNAKTLTGDNGVVLRWVLKSGDQQTSRGDVIVTTKKSDSGQPRKGEVGGMLSSGEVVRTSSGRQTTPFPNIGLDSERKALNTIKRVDQWLIDNATAEAEARGDEFNARIFRNEKVGNLPQASKDAMEEYLFGTQPEVIPPILKPLTKEPTDESQLPTQEQAEGQGETEAEGEGDADVLSDEERAFMEGMAEGAGDKPKKPTSSKPRPPSSPRQPQKPKPDAGPRQPKKPKPESDIDDAIDDLLGDIDLNVGFNPDQYRKMGVVLGKIIAAGYRKFKDAALRFYGFLKQKLGDQARAAMKKLAPVFEKGWSMRRRIDSDLDEAVDVLSVIDAEEPDTRSDHDKLVDTFVKSFTDGDKYRTITEARAKVAEALGKAIGDNMIKMVDEAVELAVVKVARGIVREKLGQQEIFGKLVDLYNRQPNLTVRTSTSMLNQAYSTPLPLAYVASQLAGIDADTKVYEPTAGNGALLIEADPKNAVANELNPERAAALRSLGFTVTEQNALDVKPGQVDVVIANPPFGKVKDDNDKAKTFVVDGASTKEIDHAIALTALRDLKGDGRAVLILGAKGDRLDAADRSNAYRTMAVAGFYKKLYDNYNVVSHVTVDGKLYRRQGAEFPVDVIVIHGKKKSKIKPPYVEAPRVISTYGDLAQLMAVHGDAAGVDSTKSDKPGSDGRPDTQGDQADGKGGVHAPAGKPGAVDGGTKGGKGSGGNPSGKTPAVGGHDRDEQTKPPGASGDQDANADGDTKSERPATDGDASDAKPGSDPDHSGSDTERLADRAASRKLNQEKETDLQVKYEPASDSNAIGTLVPTQMQESIREALNELKSEIDGSIDQWVAKELGFSLDHLENVLYAEQVDAVALAIHSHKRGAAFIIGDQTGVGKGRVVAAMMHYAMRNGMTPVFVTAKPNLFADILRDLKDIGVPINPLTTNTLYGKDKVVLGDDTELKTAKGPRHRALTESAMKSLAEGGPLAAHGKSFDAVFTTYSQFQTGENGARNWRHDRLPPIAKNAFFILDEAHEAGGDGKDPRPTKDNPNPLPRSKFFREVLLDAKGVMYSSATFAKRPDVMDLYFRTDLRHAVDDISSLQDAISHGGIPMQQAVAAMLARAGQYIRRERSFDGVDVEPVTVSADLKAADELSDLFRMIREFDRLKQDGISNIDADIAGDAGNIAHDGSIGSAGIHSTNFTSLMHNIVNQMLLALKMDSVISEVQASIERGEKPVIALSNTMESILEMVVGKRELKVGNPLEMDFREVVRKYLERSRDITIRIPGQNPETRPMTDKELGPEAVAVYNATMKAIDAAGLDKLPGSPIDYLRYKLGQLKTKDGKPLAVGEITGRHKIIEYSDKGSIYNHRNPKELGSRGRGQIINQFNSGEIDVLIINQAGSTGMSIHSSGKFKDQRRRRMIIAQPELNIDTFMQMLGRVHRTGQVIPPGYTFLFSDVPAEKRPAAVLLKKLASLNANVTASKKGAFDFEAPDIMNEVGDRVIADILTDDSDLHLALGEPLEATQNGLSPLNAASKATGRAALMTIAEQNSFWNQVTDAFTSRIAELDALGDNPLAARTADLRSVTLEKAELTPDKGVGGEFGAASYLEAVSVRKLGKPYPYQTVQEMIIDAYTKGDEQIDEDDWYDARIAPVEEKVEEYKRKFIAELAGSLPQTPQDTWTPDQIRRYAMLQPRIDAADQQWDLLTIAARALQPGTIVRVTGTNNDEIMYGQVVNLFHRGRAKNPAALGSWNIHVALAESVRELKIPLSRTNYSQFKETPYRIEPMSDYSLKEETNRSMKEWFDEAMTAQREVRFVATGNVVHAMERLDTGRIMFYSDDEGGQKYGLMLPKSFRADQVLRDMAVVFRDPKNILEFISESSRNVVASSDMNLRIQKVGDVIRFTAPRARGAGARYTLHRAALAAAGAEFIFPNKSKPIGQMDVSLGRAQAVLDAYYASGSSFIMPANWHGIDAARRLSGQDLGNAVNRFNRDKLERRKVTERPEKLSLAERLEKFANERLERIKARHANQFEAVGGVDPRDIYDLAVYVAEQVGAKGIRILNKVVALTREAADAVKAAIAEHAPHLDGHDDAVLKQLRKILAASVSGDDLDHKKLEEVVHEGVEDSERRAKRPRGGGPKRPTIERSKDEPSPPSMTSGRNVDWERDRAKMSLPMMDSSERRKQEAIVKQVINTWSVDRTTALVHELAQSGRLMTDEEFAAIIVRLAELNNNYNDLLKEARQESGEGPLGEARLRNMGERQGLIQNEFDFITAVAKKSKASVARTLAMAKMTLSSKMEVVSVVNRARIAWGRNVTPDERAEFERLIAEHEARHQQEMAILRQRMEAEAQEAIDQARREAQEYGPGPSRPSGPAPEAPEATPEAPQEAPTTTATPNTLDELVAEAKRLIERGCIR